MKKIIASFIVALFSIPCFAQEKTTDIYANNIVVVFDASGSMGDPIGNRDSTIKIIAAKKALKQVLSKTDNNTNIGLFVFGDVSNNNPVPLGPRNIALLNKSIDSIQTGGSTPLGEYLEKAANQLLQQRQKNMGYGRYKILVVTDGEATDGSKMRQVAPEIMKRNLNLDVIGVGMNGEHELAKMSSSYRAANDTVSLNKALADIVAETPAKNTDSSNDFALIQGLTEEQAKVIVLVLGNNENQPLFQKPKSLTQAADESKTKTSQFPTFFTGIIIVIVIVVIIITQSN